MFRSVNFCHIILDRNELYYSVTVREQSKMPGLFMTKNSSTVSMENLNHLLRLSVRLVSSFGARDLRHFS